MLDGSAERERADMRKRAWVLSHSLIAAGCDANKVTVAKLLGEKEPRTRSRLIPEEKKAREAQLIWKRVLHDREMAAKGEVK